MIDDNDDFIRKAADNYPLNTNSSDWESVSARLRKNERFSLFRLSKTKKKAILISTFLVFILASSVLLLNESQKNSVNALNQNNNTLTKTTDDNSDKIKLQHNKKHQGPQPKQLITNSNLSANFSDLHQKNFYELPSTILKSEESSTVEENLLQDNIYSADQILNNSVSDSHQALNNQKNDVTVTIDKSLQKEIPVIKTPATIKATNTNTKRIYAGFLASPEISTVNNQDINKVGYAFGFIAGLEVNNKLGIEIGLVRSNKKYYTHGQYFSYENLKLRQTTVIESLHGNNIVTEIPVNFRYNIICNDENRLFGSLGTSAVFVHKETYNYTLNRNGIIADVDRNYKKGQTRIMPNMQLSLGYESKIGNAGSLRVEPYYKIPLSKMGIGDVPLTSFGINVGIVKDLNF